MAEWQLQWQSTPKERYETDMLQRSDAMVHASQVRVLESFGGSGLSYADNGYVIDATYDEAVLLAAYIGLAVHRDINVTRYAP